MFIFFHSPLGWFGLLVAMSVSVFVCLFIYFFLPFPCNCFWYLSFGLRSHDQFKEFIFFLLFAKKPLWRRQQQQWQGRGKKKLTVSLFVNAIRKQILVLLSASVKRFCVSRKRVYFFYKWQSTMRGIPNPQSTICWIHPSLQSKPFGNPLPPPSTMTTLSHVS